MNTEEATTPIVAAADTPAPTEEEEKKKSSSSSSSKKKDHHSKKDDKKKEHTKKEDKKKDEKSHKKKSHKKKDDKDGEKKNEEHKKQDVEKPNEEAPKVEEEPDTQQGKQEQLGQLDDADTQKVVTLLTQDYWETESDEDVATLLQSLQALSKTQVNLCLEMGAPLLVARKMKECATTSAAVQTAGLELMHSFAATFAATSTWYTLFIRIGGWTRMQDILAMTETTEEWQPVQEKALTMAEEIVKNNISLFMHHNGVETMTSLFVQQEKSQGALLDRVSQLLYTLATTNTDGRDKVVKALSPLLTSQEQDGQTAVLAFFSKLLPHELGKADLAASIVSGGAWTQIQTVLTTGSQMKVVDDPGTVALQDKAMGLFEQMAKTDPATAELLVQQSGVETLKAIVQGKNGALIPRALEVLYQVSATSGTTGRAKITLEMGELLRDSPYQQLQSAVVSLLGEMAVDEETAQGLVQGQGIESLVYAWEACRGDRQTVSDKALDLLVLLAVKGGATSRQAIIDSGILQTIADIMRAEPANDTIHTRGKQLAAALKDDHEPAVDESGILTI